MNGHLFLFDFDGSIAQTFKPGPFGISVKEAYERSIYDIFGGDGLVTYEQLGGLKNRAVSELVHDLFSRNVGLTEMTRGFYEKNNNYLRGLVPEGKGFDLTWDPERVEQIAGELLVRQKLSYLIGQIDVWENGSVWPEPCNGFRQFWRVLNEIKCEDGSCVSTGVVSSGHDLFIKRTFDVWDLPHPDFLVTEDDVRGRAELPDRIDLRVKPGPFPMMLAYERWRELQKRPFQNNEIHTPLVDGDHIMYFGDDPHKDGEMAVRNGVYFGLFGSDHSKFYSFRDWQQMTGIFERDRGVFLEGRPLSELFYPRRKGIEL